MNDAARLGLLASALWLGTGCSAAQADDPVEPNHDSGAGGSGAGTSSQPVAGAPQGGSGSLAMAGSSAQTGGNGSSAGSPAAAGASTGGMPPVGGDEVP